MPARLGHHRRRVVLPEAGSTTNFGSAKEVKGNSTKIVLVALDQLYLYGYDLAHDPEKCAAVFSRDKREAFARRSCANNKLKRHGDST